MPHNSCSAISQLSSLGKTFRIVSVIQELNNGNTQCCDKCEIKTNNTQQAKSTIELKTLQSNKVSMSSFKQVFRLISPLKIRKQTKKSRDSKQDDSSNLSIPKNQNIISNSLSMFSSSSSQTEENIELQNKNTNTRSLKSCKNISADKNSFHKRSCLDIVDHKSRQLAQEQRKFSLNSQKIIEFKFDVIVEEDVDSRHQEYNSDEFISAKNIHPSLHEEIDRLAESFIKDYNDSCIFSITNGKQRDEYSIFHLSEIILKKIFTGYKKKVCIKIKGVSFCVDDEDADCDSINFARLSDLSELAISTQSGNNLKQVKVLDLVSGKRLYDKKPAENNNYEEESDDEELLQELECSDFEVALMNLNIIKRCVIKTNGKHDLKDKNKECAFESPRKSKNTSLKLTSNEGKDKKERNEDEKAIQPKLILIKFTVEHCINGGLFTSNFFLLEMNFKFDMFKEFLVSLFDGNANSMLNDHEQIFELYRSSLLSPSCRSSPSPSTPPLHEETFDSGRCQRDEALYDITTFERENHNLHNGINVAGSVRQVQLVRKFIQAERLIYTQLNSVLTQTLLVAHVGKVDLKSRCFEREYNDIETTRNTRTATKKKARKSQLSTNTRNETIEVEDNGYMGNRESCISRRLIDENFNILNYATCLKEAALCRNERHKKHLKSTQLNLSSSGSMTKFVTDCLATPLRIPLKPKQKFNSSLLRKRLCRQQQTEQTDKNSKSCFHDVTNHHNQRHNGNFDRKHNLDYDCRSLKQRTDAMEELLLWSKSRSKQSLVRSCMSNRNSLQRLKCHPSSKNLRQDSYCQDKRKRNKSNGYYDYTTNNIQNSSNRNGSVSTRSETSSSSKYYSQHQNDIYGNDVGQKNNCRLSNAIVSDQIYSNLSSKYDIVNRIRSHAIPTATAVVQSSSSSVLSSRHSSVTRVSRDSLSSMLSQTIRTTDSERDEYSGRKKEKINLDDIKQCMTIINIDCKLPLGKSKTNGTQEKLEHLQRDTLNGSLGKLSTTSEMRCKDDHTLTRRSTDNRETEGGSKCNFVAAKDDENAGDDISDITSIVAQPLKQLKLEKYLNRLNEKSCSAGGGFATFVGDKLWSNDLDRQQHDHPAEQQHLNGCASLKLTQLVEHLINQGDQTKLDQMKNLNTSNVGKATDIGDDDDDEDLDDCKSHSSVLEKLSYLAIDNKSNKLDQDKILDSYPTLKSKNMNGIAKLGNDSIYPKIVPPLTTEEADNFDFFPPAPNMSIDMQPQMSFKETTYRSNASSSFDSSDSMSHSSSNSLSFGLKSKLSNQIKDPQMIRRKV